MQVMKIVPAPSGDPAPAFRRVADAALLSVTQPQVSP
jgi:hypothetical protein